MFVRFIRFAMLLLFPVLLLSSIRAEDEQLISVQIVIRHAERAPISGFTSTSSAKFFPRGLGEISDIGIQRSSQLGRTFRQRYRSLGLLKSKTSDDEIFIRSSPINRSLVSAASFSSAFLGRTSNNPIPLIHTTRSKKDERALIIQDSPSFRCKVLAKYKLKDRLCNTYQLKKIIVGSYPECGSFNYNLITAAIAEMAQPGVKMNARLRECARDQGLQIKYRVLNILPGIGHEFNLQRVRESVGNLVAILARNIDRAVTNTARESIRIYYTHDDILLALAESFGIISTFNEKAPEFSSAVVIETWRTKNGRVINIILKNGVFSQFKDVARFELSSFIERISPFVEKDPRKIQWDENLVEVYGNDRYQKDLRGVS